MAKNKSAGIKQYAAVVIGGGASGLCAAIFCAENGGEVCVFERENQPAKKILRTGNGRCNLSNEHQGASCYRGTDPSFVDQVLSEFDLSATLDFFFQIGIYPRSLGGYLYPYSLQAKDVKTALERKAANLGIVIHCGTRITSVVPSKKGYLLSCESNGSSFKVFAKAVILSCGSSAGLPENTPDDAENILKNLSVPFIPREPALCALRCSDRWCKTLHGIRAKGAVTLLIDGKTLRTEEGELQFTDYGLSGIPVFCLSRDASYALSAGKQVSCTVDLMPELAEEDICDLLTRRLDLCEQSTKPVRTLLSGLFAGPFCELLETALEQPLSEKAIRALAALIKHIPFHVTGTKGMTAAQTAAGGASLLAVDPKTMEAIDHPGLFLTGETLDCDGICGGYNLQWAWSTGALAGKAAAFYLENK